MVGHLQYESAAAAIRDIAAALELPVDDLGVGRPAVEAINLTDGSAGIAVMFAQLARASERHTGLGDPQRWQAAALAQLNHAIVGVGTVPMGPDLSAGLAGVAWAMAHVGRTAGIDVEVPAALDDMLLSIVNIQPWRGDFDLISGLVGLGVYFVERWPTAIAVQGLREIVERLTDLAEYSQLGATWHTPAERLASSVRERFPTGYYDLGLAHGVPGVIAFLTTALELDQVEGTRGLLDAAVNWLLAHELPDGGFAWAHAAGVASHPARLAWCYGDPGVGVALLRAGRALQRPDVVERATALVRGACRRPLAHSGVEDVGFCHGGAGLLHMLARAHELAPSHELHAAISRWAAWTLAARSLEREATVAGFFAYNYRRGQRYAIAERGLLNGAAGVALALLTAIDPDARSWDRVLLLSGLSPDVWADGAWGHDPNLRRVN